MKLGILTTFDEERLRFASAAGFNCVELAFQPGSDISPSTFLDGEAERIRSFCDDLGLTITAIGSYQNNLDPDEATRDKHIEHFTNLIAAAKALEVSVVTTFAGRDPEKSIEDNIPGFKKVYKPLAKHAEDQGVKIAFENCPMMHQHPFRGINIAISPEAWDMMFDAVPSMALGLEYDPSHLFWLEIDYIAVIHRFADRIYHVHAKDTEVMAGKLAQQGIYGGGWWRYRIPGWGSVDWKQVFAALIDIGFEGGVAIEHEDPVFHGDRFEEGFTRGYTTLAPYFFDLPAK